MANLFIEYSVLGDLQTPKVILQKLQKFKKHSAEFRVRVSSHRGRGMVQGLLKDNSSPTSLNNNRRVQLRYSV